MSWKEIELGSAIRVKHGFAFKSEGFSDIGDFVVLTPGNFYEKGGFRIRPDKERYYVGEIPEGFVLHEGDVIVAMTEQADGLLGSSAWIPTSGKYLHNQRLGLIEITEPKTLNKRFLYHLFNSRPVRAQISASASGTKVRHTAPERIYRVKALIPDVPAQERIAESVENYDLLIENNRRRIHLLEQSARLLYKEWFVNLRFPGHEHVKVVDGVPKGWEKVPLSYICDDVRETVRPNDIDPTTAYIGLEHIPRRTITLSEWGKAEDVTSNKFRFRQGDILFGRIRPYFHKVGFALTDGITSSDTIVIRPYDIDLYHLILMLVSSEHFVAVASKTAKEGSKMPRADWKHLKTFAVTVPKTSLREAFGDAMAPIVSQLKTLAFHSRKLSEARELLLPRLMSGEIEV